MSKKDKLVKCLTELDKCSFRYIYPEVARRINANAERVLKLIFEIGILKLQFTSEEKQKIRLILEKGIRAIQANIERTGCVYRTRLDTATLRKRSALQFLVDDYADFPTLSVPLVEYLSQVEFQVAIDILDDIICKWHNQSDSEEPDSDLEAAGVPASHTWWCLLLTRNVAEGIESDNVPRSFYSHFERQKSSPPNAPKPHTRSAAMSGTPRGSNSEGTTNSSTTSGSGSQPPEDSNPTYKNEQELDPNDSNMTVFLKIFKVFYLEDITVGAVHIFVGLKTEQKKSLEKLINQLKINGCLVGVIETVRDLFNKMNPQDVSFQMFLSLTQFVATYLGERAARRAECELIRTSAWRLVSYDIRLQNYVDSAANDIRAPSSACKILTEFKRLYSQISRFTCVPSFRNVYSAIYHYSKHRAIPEMGEILSVPQYFGIITSMLHKVRTSKEYTELTDPAHARRELVFDRVFLAFGRRVRLVLKMQDEQLELSSCYFLDVLENDQDSDEFIDNIKKT